MDIGIDNMQPGMYHIITHWAYFENMQIDPEPYKGLTYPALVIFSHDCFYVYDMDSFVKMVEGMKKGLDLMKEHNG